MDLKTKIKLAKLNGTYERLYGDSVNQKVRKQYKESDEIALLRKEIALLRKEIALLKGETIDNNEFSMYNDYVENCKTEIKKELEEEV